MFMEEHRRVGYLPMDFHYDGDGARRRGDFYRIYPLTSRAPLPSVVARRVRLKCYFHLVARRCREGVILRQEKSSSKIGKYREMCRRTGWQDVRNFCEERPGKREREKRREEGEGWEAYRESWVGRNISGNLRSEIKLFSCDFLDMYLLLDRNAVFISSWWRERRFCRERKLH